MTTPADTPVPRHLSEEERALWEKMEAATQNEFEWEAWSGDGAQWVVSAGATMLATTLAGNDAANAEFIAAANPAVMRSLLTALSAAREAGEKLRSPDMFWLYDDPETGADSIEDFREMIEVGETAKILVVHALPSRWAAHVRIPETPTSDEDSEVQLFATEAEALAATAAPSTETPR